MLFRAALLLLAAWVAGILGVFRVGEIVHVLLLIGLLLLLLGFMKARDAALE